MDISKITDHGNNTDTFRTPVVIIPMSSCIMSILGSFIIFGSYLLIPDIRNSTRKFLTCLTVADCLTALRIFISMFAGYLISSLAHFAGTQDALCTPQSVITTYSSLVSFFLTVAIAIHIFATVVYKQDFTSTWIVLLVANTVSWIIPGIIIITAGADGVLGRDSAESVDTGPWCWLKNHHKHYTLWMLMTGKGWEFLCYLLTTSLYVLLKLYLYLKHKYQGFGTIHESLREYDKNYLYVWFVLYVLRLWGSIRSMMSLTGVDGSSPGDRISEVFMYMQAVGDPGQAFCNCVLFCFLDSTVRSHLCRTCFSGTQNEVVIHDEMSGLLQSDLQHKYTAELPHAARNDAISGSRCVVGIERRTNRSDVDESNPVSGI